MDRWKPQSLARMFMLMRMLAHACMCTQGEALNVDRRELHSRLYESLLLLAMRGVVEPPQEQQGQQGEGAPAGGPRGKGGEEAEAADPAGTAALAACAAGGAVGLVAIPGAAGAAPAPGMLPGGGVEEPLSVLLGSVLGQVSRRRGLFCQGS